MELYTFAIENLTRIYPEFESLFREHYSEMQARKAALGIEIGDYNPRLEEYFKANDAGWLLFFTARNQARIPVGHALIYLTNDMHNRDFIAQEDMIFVSKAHRNGLGRRLAKVVLCELKKRGAKNLSIVAATDPRAAHLWRRMGFKETGIQMTYTL